MKDIDKFIQDFEQGLEQRKNKLPPKPVKRKQQIKQVFLSAFDLTQKHNHIFVYQGKDTYVVNCEFKQVLDTLNILVLASSTQLGGKYVRFYMNVLISEVETVGQLQLKVAERLSVDKAL